MIDLDPEYVPTITFHQVNNEPLVTIPVIEHNDDVAVLKFSNAMRAKLASKRPGRGGWETPDECSVQYLKWLLVRELSKPIVDTVDVANYCMMLHQRGIEKLDETGNS